MHGYIKVILKKLKNSSKLNPKYKPVWLYYETPSVKSFLLKCKILNLLKVTWTNSSITSIHAVFCNLLVEWEELMHTFRLLIEVLF